MAANISTETYSILHDSRGEDVRDSLCEACQKIALELLPVVTTEDAGKVMGVNSSGQWVAASFIPYWKLNSITVTTRPTKTSYFVGDTLDLSGVVVTASYSSDFEADKTEVVTANCTFSPADGDTLVSGTQSITVTFSDSGETKTATIPITVTEVTLESIAVTTAPTTTSYFAGDQLDLTGIVVTATYNNESTAVVTSNCTFSPANGDTLTAGTSAVTVSYTESGVTKTATTPITVAAIVPTSITITTMPTKTSYYQDEELDLTGIVVTAAYNDGTSAVVTSNCTFLPGNGSMLTAVGTNTITASYSSNGTTVNTSFAVSVAAVGVTSIAITTMPTKTQYDKDEKLDLTGIVVTATYDNGTTHNVTEQCSYSPANGSTLSEAGTQAVTISYSRNGATVTTSCNITVIDNDTPVGIIAKTSSYAMNFRVYSPSNTNYHGFTSDNVSIYTVNSDGRELQRIRNADCVFSIPTGYRFTTEGVQTVTVSYTTTVNGSSQTFTDSFDITVHKGYVKIEMPTLPSKTNYNVGDIFTVAGCRVIVTYTDGSTRDVTNSNDLSFMYDPGSTVESSWIEEEMGVTGYCDMQYSYNGREDDGFFAFEIISSSFRITIND